MRRPHTIRYYATSFLFCYVECDLYHIICGSVVVFHHEFNFLIWVLYNFPLPEMLFFWEITTLGKLLTFYAYFVTLMVLTRYLFKSHMGVLIRIYCLLSLWCLVSSSVDLTMSNYLWWLKQQYFVNTVMG